MLSLRLKTIEKMVDPEKIVADIGTDHALLPVQLVLSGKISKAYAVDNKIGPYQRAVSHIRTSNCESSVISILGDGLMVVPKDADCWIIAGMGYDTAAMILDQRPFVNAGQLLIIQVNHGVDNLRSYLMAKGWQIIDEEIIYEAHYYQIIKAVKVKSVVRLKAEDIAFGPILRKEKSPVFTEYWSFQIQKLQKIVNQLDHGSKRGHQLQKQIHFIKEMLNG
jgi:tRNA (adenine22-N1)-methyltransferase